MFVSPHGIHVDRQGNVWLVDGAARDGKGNQVFKISPDGKVLMTLGKAGQPPAMVPIRSARPRTGGESRPTGTSSSLTATAATDGNARIVKFSKDGAFIKAWGRKGTGPGEFDAPHFARDGPAWTPVRHRSRKQPHSNVG